jgi:hypothetical protein
VDRLFANAPDRHEELRRNPVDGGCFVSGLDPIEPQKGRAERALLAREWFRSMAPDRIELPLGYREREDMKRGGVAHIVAWFARSLNVNGYDIERHPLFNDYARGVLASPYAPDFITSDAALAARFPPRPLAGLGPGLIWNPGHATLLHSKAKR